MTAYDPTRRFPAPLPRKERTLVKKWLVLLVLIVLAFTFGRHIGDNQPSEVSKCFNNAGYEVPCR